ncbi:MAG TPA: sigma-54 dependent transcriptional regulator [Verrucomicrobiota bacterium]|nr:sigma-54 dependent transcriptional regulator [Verrucomicrobiota bacterium]
MDTLLLIDDDADMQYSFRRIFDSPEIALVAASSGEEGLRLLPKLRPDLVIMDIRMCGLSGLETLRRMRQIDARLPVIMMTAYGTTQTAIEAMKLGAYDYLLKPFDVPKLKQTVLAALKTARAMRSVVSYEPLLESEDYELGIVGRCEAMQGVFKLVGQLAASDATAFITGESGTGKELVARAIYHHSRRAQQPFVAINCAAIPENLLESELFGHERGAFTGAAAQRVGKFEQSHGGTIFLDEIGDMSLPTQTKILRVLQDGSFERVGGNETIQADVRIIAATNQDIERAVAERRFREDLFYRLNVVRIRLPPLRERRGDVRLLVNYFLKAIARDQEAAPKSIAADALEALEAFRWPGNVRELENVIHRATVVAKGDAILLDDLPAEITGASECRGGEGKEDRGRGAGGSDVEGAVVAAEVGHSSASDLSALAARLFQWARQHPELKVLPAVERELVVRALEETRGNQVQAAQLLGITRATLRKRMERFGITSALTFR